MHGNFFLTFSRASTLDLTVPPLAGASASGAKRTQAPSQPPEASSTTKVPQVWKARRRAPGSSRSTSFLKISATISLYCWLEHEEGLDQRGAFHPAWRGVLGSLALSDLADGGSGASYSVAFIPMFPTAPRSWISGEPGWVQMPPDGSPRELTAGCEPVAGPTTFLLFSSRWSSSLSASLLVTSASASLFSSSFSWSGGARAGSMKTTGASGAGVEAWNLKGLEGGGALSVAATGEEEEGAAAAAAAAAAGAALPPPASARRRRLLLEAAFLSG